MMPIPSNVNLSNERISHVSAGFTHRINERWDVLVEAYAQQLDDLVQFLDWTGKINTENWPPNEQG